MTIEQLYAKYGDKQHLLGTIPPSAYARIVLYALDLQAKMGRTMEELAEMDERTLLGRPSATSRLPQDAKVKRRTTTAPSGLEIVAPGAFSAKKAS